MYLFTFFCNFYYLHVEQDSFLVTCCLSSLLLSDKQTVRQTDRQFFVTSLWPLPFMLFRDFCCQIFPQYSSQPNGCFPTKSSSKQSLERNCPTQGFEPVIPFLKSCALFSVDYASVARHRRDKSRSFAAY